MNDTAVDRQLTVGDRSENSVCDFSAERLSPKDTWWKALPSASLLLQTDPREALRQPTVLYTQVDA